MRDIRPDLQERIDAIAADRAVLQGRLAALDDRERSLKAELAAENSRIRSLAVEREELPFPTIPLVGGMGIGDLIKNTLRSRQRRPSFNELRDEIAQTPYNFSGQKPGRVIQGGLMVLLHSGEVIKDADGRYRLPTPLFSVRETTQ